MVQIFHDGNEVYRCIFLCRLPIIDGRTTMKAPFFFQSGLLPHYKPDYSLLFSLRPQCVDAGHFRSSACAHPPERSSGH